MNDAMKSSGDGLMSCEDALEFLLSNAALPDECEELDTMRCLGRVLAAPVTSGVDVPGWDNSAMDGYAVNTSDIPTDGKVTLPISQRIPAGTQGEPLQPGSAARIFTGAPVPSGADAVVMQERCVVEGESVRLRLPVTAGENIRPRGNDIASGSEILPAGTRIRPQEMGLAASVGIGSLSVFRRLRVALFTTGDELVAPGNPLGEGQIYNSNHYLLQGLLGGLGCDVRDLGVIEDSFETTRQALREGAETADLVITTGGVSVGEEDHIKKAVAEEGELNLWRIRIKPGKPLAFGRVGGADFVGLPGNPVSALVTFLLFVRPFILRRQGVEDVEPARIPVTAGFGWDRPRKRREYVRARIRQDETGRAVAELFPRQGSDVLTSTVWGHGLLEIPENSTVAKGEPLNFLSFSELLG